MSRVRQLNIVNTDKTSKMDDERDPGDVFAIPDLWGLSKCVDDLVQPSSLFSTFELPGSFSKFGYDMQSLS